MSLTYKVPVYIEVSGDIESLKRYIFFVRQCMDIQIIVVKLLINLNSLLLQLK